MGLDVSHDAFSGAYSAFNRFRGAVAEAMGGSFPPHKPGARDDEGKPMDPRMWYWGDGYTAETHPGLMVFLAHEDCDGEISPEDCVKVADELEMLLPKLAAAGLGLGHIERAGGYAAVAEKFIAGCRCAAAENEPLVFE